MRTLKKKLLYIIIPLILLSLVYISAERMLISKIKNDIESSFGNEYAVIALHVAGENSQKPSLWRMLKKAMIYELNINGEYTPTGSGGYTGKKHHLAILITNNQEITFGEWSFRNWSLILSDYSSSWDIIENLSESDQELYSYEREDINKRGGISYKDRVLNDNEISFYYRSTEAEFLPKE